MTFTGHKLCLQKWKIKIMIIPWIIQYTELWAVIYSLLWNFCFRGVCVWERERGREELDWDIKCIFIVWLVIKNSLWKPLPSDLCESRDTSVHRQSQSGACGAVGDGLRGRKDRVLSIPLRPRPLSSAPTEQASFCLADRKQTEKDWGLAQDTQLESGEIIFFPLHRLLRVVIATKGCFIALTSLRTPEGAF